MITFLTIVHIIVSIFLILVVLLQQGKGQDFASTFGGGGTQASFGARAATTILHRLTTVAAIMFMLTSLSLTILISRPGTGSVISGDAQPIQAEPALDETVPATDDAQPDVEALPDTESETDTGPDN